MNHDSIFNKRKRILFLIHTLGGGGAERALINTVNHMNQEKYVITVMTVIDTGIYRSQLAEGITYKSMLRPPIFLNKENRSGSLLHKESAKLPYLIRLYTSFWKFFPMALVHKLWIGNRYDFEVAFLEGICAKIIAASGNPHSRKYAWIHVDMSRQHKSANVFRSERQEKATYDRFDKIIAVSQYAAEQFRALFSFHPEKITVCYNPVDRETIVRQSRTPPAVPPLQKRGFTVCSIGRLNQQKSYLRLLHCHKRLIEEGHSIDLWIIGEGTDRKNLEEYISDNGLSDSVHLLGFQENPYWYLAQADLFVCSSIAEGFSMSATEAAVLGVPIVTTDCSGMKELLGESEYGIITENTEEGLYEGMRKMLDDPALRRRYAKAASERGKRYDLSCVKEIESLFDPTR